MHFLRCGGEVESERLCEWIQRKEPNTEDETFAVGQERDGTEKRRERKKEGERKDEKRDQLGRVISKRACQCTVGGTRSLGTHRLFFFLAFFPLFHARFSSRSSFLSFLYSARPIFPRARFGTLIHVSLPRFLFSALATNAFSENLGNARPRLLSFQVIHTGANAESKIYVAFRSMISAQKTRRSYCLWKVGLKRDLFFFPSFPSCYLAPSTLRRLSIRFRTKLSSQRHRVI